MQARDADDFVRNPPRRHLAAQWREQRLVADLCIPQLHQQDGPLAPLEMRAPDDGRERHLGILVDQCLDLGRVDPLAARLDQILGAAGDDEIALGVDARQVAGGEPAVGIRGALLLAEVALDHGRPAHAQVPFHAALLG